MDVFTLDQMIGIANAYMDENDIIHVAEFKEYHTRCASIDFPLDNAQTPSGARMLVIKQKNDYNQYRMKVPNNVIFIQFEAPDITTTPIIFNTETELRSALLQLIPQKILTFEHRLTTKRLISIEEKLDKILKRDG